MTTYVSVDLVVGATSQPIISSGGSQSCTIMKAQAVNVGGTNKSLSVFRVPAGGSPSTFNRIIPGVALATGASSPTILPLSGQVAEAGKAIFVASGTSASILVSISYAINSN